MNYYLFIDETGDHGLTTLNPDFPLFLLCGTLLSNNAYEQLSDEFNSIKQKLWGNKSVYFIAEIFVSAKKSLFYYLI